jgi:hypothetical protein
MDIGREKRTIYIEPIELPEAEPIELPEAEPGYAPEAEPAPVEAPSR